MSTSNVTGRPSSLLLLLFIGYTSLSFARRALQDVFTAELTIPGNRLDATQLGVILSSQTLGYTITKLVSGIFMDQLNPSAVFVFTLWSTAVSLFFMALSSNRYCWFVMYTVNGLALGVGWPAVAKILRTSVAPNELATWWGVLSAAVNVAGGLGPWLTMSIMSVAVVWLGSDAWRSTFIIIGQRTGLGGSLDALIDAVKFNLERLGLGLAYGPQCWIQNWVSVFADLTSDRCVWKASSQNTCVRLNYSTTGVIHLRQRAQL